MFSLLKPFAIQRFSAAQNLSAELFIERGEKVFVRIVAVIALCLSRLSSLFSLAVSLLITAYSVRRVGGFKGKRYFLFYGVHAEHSNLDDIAHFQNV